MVKVRCINEVGYNDIKLKRFIGYNKVIEVDEERAKYLVETRGLCERVEDKTDENEGNNLDDNPNENHEDNDNNLDDKTNENIDKNKSNKEGKK